MISLTARRYCLYENVQKWKIFLLLLPAVSCISVNNSAGSFVCPGKPVRFVCSLNSPLLAWSSPYYIGAPDSGIRIEFTSVDGEGSVKHRMMGTNSTLLRLNGTNVLDSELYIIPSQEFPSVSVTCEDDVGNNDTSQFEVSDPPDMPQDVAVTDFESPPDRCVLLIVWNRPNNVDSMSIDNYIIRTSRALLSETQHVSGRLATFQAPCNELVNLTINITAIDICGRMGTPTANIQPSLVVNIDSPTTDTSTVTDSSTVMNSPAPTSIYAVAAVGAVLILIGFIVLIIASVMFFMHYKRGKKVYIQPDEQEEPLFPLNHLQQDVHFGHLIQHDLQKLYKALKLQPENDGKIRVAAKALNRTLYNRSSNEHIKEALKDYLEQMQTEKGEDIHKALDKMDNTITGMTGVSNDFKDCVRHLCTEANSDKHRKVLDDLIKKVDKEEPDKIIVDLRTFCEKLQYLQQVKDFYQTQSKYDREKDLGTGEDRVRVPIWVNDKVADTWKCSLREAVEAINEAAPGLSLSITDDKEGAIVHVLATKKEEAYTEGNILMRSIARKSDFITKIYLGKQKDDRKKGISIHELLHALGFHHERPRFDAQSYKYPLDSGGKLTINENLLRLICFDSSSTTVYQCEKKTCECKEHSEDPVCIWLLKAYPTQGNAELDELDMVGLNLAYRPCVYDATADNVKYRPREGENGMCYCEREVMRGHICPSEGYTRCGPNNGPNCPACRTIKSQKVEMILKGGRWQGMTGRVYCGRPFVESAQISIAHDGMCGADNGPACPDCNRILNQKI